MKRLLAALAAVAVAATALVIGTAPAFAGSSDKRTAQAGVIVADDVPSDWDSTPADTSDDKQLEKAAKKVRECKTYLSARKSLDKATTAESRDFTTGDEGLSNEVYVFSSTSKAKKAYAQMSDDSVEGCITALFQSQFESIIAGDASVRDVQVVIVQTTDLPSLGDDVVGYTGGAVATLADGSVQRLPVGNFVVRVGPSILSYTFSGGPTATGEYTPAFVTGVDGAIDATVSRMEDAVA